MGGLEIRNVADQSGAEIGLVGPIDGLGGVAETKAVKRIDDAKTAALSGCGAVLATSGVVDRAGVRAGRVHKSPQIGMEGGYIPCCFVKCAERVEKKGVTGILRELVCAQCAQIPENKVVRGEACF